MRLSEIAHTRSGDKGSSSNIGVIAIRPEYYPLLKERLTAALVEEYFGFPTVRYELDNLHALNFVISGILEGGGSLSLHWDSQGKGLGQKLLEIEL